MARDSVNDGLNVDDPFTGHAADTETSVDVPIDVEMEAGLSNEVGSDSAVVGENFPPPTDSGSGGLFNNLPFLISGVVLSIIGLVVFQTFETQRAATQTEHTERSSRLLVLSQQVANAAAAAADGADGAFDLLREKQQEFSATVQFLDKGDPGQNVAPLPDSDRGWLTPVISLWQGTQTGVQSLLGFEEVLNDTRRHVTEINELAPLMLTKADEVVDAVAAETGDPELVNESGQQRSLSQRIAKDANVYARGGARAATAVDQIGRDLNQLRDATAELRRVGGPVTMARLEDAGETLDSFERSAMALLENSGDYLSALEVSAVVDQSVDELLPAVQGLVLGVSTGSGAGNRSYIPWILGALVVLFLLLLGRALVNDARARADQNARQNRESQDAILKLLDEMGSLADGDLTIEAEVTDQITGAIADSVNFAVKEMRDLVTRIKDASLQVGSESRATAQRAQQLSEASGKQTGLITATTETVESMSRSMSRMSDEALRSAEVARNSVDVAKRGGQAVRDTIRGMDGMRDQIQETSKRIKRLGESSQQISDIVGLIEDIAEQTNILSLNAAIQAAMAGEAGRGFAVVADEVQRLAERSAEATKQISGLVKNIQADTNEAVTSMEFATQGVVDGTRLADGAGQALGEIESVSEQLSDLIGSIAEAAHDQSESATGVSSQMTSIRDVTNKTLEEARNTADSLGRLLNLARELEQSVAGFKIPN